MLNRTLLHRQYLSARTTASVRDVMARLVAVQAQEPNWAFAGLWTRIDGFERSHLESLLIARQVARSTMIRRTMHIALADDFAWLRPTLQPMIARAANNAYLANEIDGIDLDELVGVGRRLLAGRSMLRRDLGQMLSAEFPGRHTGRLADAVWVLEPMVHDAETSRWGRWTGRSNISVELATDYLGRDLEPADVERMILRYLAAFGPASVRDMQAWSGMTRLGEVVDGMADRLRTHADDDGRILYDVLDGELADPDGPVPVRFLPAFDNALLGHKDRRRVINEDDRVAFAAEASAGVPMALVDGFVQATWEWRWNENALVVHPLRRWSDDDSQAVLDEATRMAAFLAGDDAEPAVKIGDLA